MFGTGLNELVILILLIAVLSATGLWPRIAQGLKDLKGGGYAGGEASAQDLDMCYKILGISSSSPWGDIEKAYRRKAQIHHPDKGGDEDAMRVLNDAYSRLKKYRKSFSS